MSSVGRMDNAFFVSRGELLHWVNTVFLLSLQKIEQCSNGAVYCQIIDACHPGSVHMKKVNWAAKFDHESLPNFKALQQAFERCEIKRNIEVDKLVRGKYQDNLEFLQWIKTYYDRTYQGGDYDPLARRFTDNLPEWARVQDGVSRPLTGELSASRRDQFGRAVRDTTARRGNAGISQATQNTSHAEVEGVREEQERLREEVDDLQIAVCGLESERDFFFQKLRDVEILCQAVHENPDPNMTVMKFVEDVQRILYAEDKEDESRDEGVLSDPMC
eukprot:TRINITY_DN8396_c0_g2_i1.p1 TRINITY_DN8396_c0_g2~~TRINITY_DN8396_c0_g2_i1.p1  ORF type:complete len:274 (+),score=43.90 TRINITY_DN8396_c0_g2_i1:224-1045(+)